MGNEGLMAGKYLRFMKAEPASDREKRSISGPCSPQSSKSADAAKAEDPRTKRKSRERKPEAKSTVKTEGASSDRVTAKQNIVLNIKTTKSQTLFYGEYTMKVDEMESKITGKALQLGMSAAKGGAKINGPMHFIFQTPQTANVKEITFKMGLPVSGRPKTRGGFKILNDKGFKCSWMEYNGHKDGLMDAWKTLYEQTTAAGHKLTGESRQIFDEDNKMGSDTIKVELQLGIQ